MKTSHKRAWAAGGVGAVVVALLFATPERVPVEVAPVTRGPLVVAVEASARTRVRERRIVVAPSTGHLARIRLRAGDVVAAGDVLTTIGSPASAPVDPRTRAELEARLASAVAGAAEASAAVERAALTQAHAARELERVRPLLPEGGVSRQAVDAAEFEHEVRRAEARAAELARRTAARNVAVARAQLLGLDEATGGPAEGAMAVQVRAPAPGRVLRVLCESEGPVPAGTPLLELGDPSSLEAVVEVLTSDAVGIEPGAPVRFERWGGTEPLRGTVRLVEPSGYTRLSALGVEEQRVNVIVEPDGDPAPWSRLGDGYRLEARIVLWEAESLKVPVAALARDADGWSAFVVRDGRAEWRRVGVGRRGQGEAQVTDGLAPGEAVALHPSGAVRDGVRVERVR